MKKILLLLTMFLSFATQAQDFTPTNWVSDLGNFYTPEQEASLNGTISAYENSFINSFIGHFTELPYFKSDAGAEKAPTVKFDFK